MELPSSTKLQILDTVPNIPVIEEPIRPSKNGHDITPNIVSASKTPLNTHPVDLSIETESTEETPYHSWTYVQC